MPAPRSVYAKLPQAPINGSPVPELTSLYHKEQPGRYGDRRYPGNCSGELIKDLLRYFRPGQVFDPMTGSGTCREVCADLGIPCVSSDLHKGFDACDPKGYPPGRFDFIWLHPPYWRQKIYSDDPRDLSTAPTLQDFLDRYQKLIENCTQALAPGGKLVILMGDYTDRVAGFVPLTYHTKRLGFACGLRQPCTDIVRFSHGASSGKKVYRSAFIPGLHDMCVILEKPSLACERIASLAKDRLTADEITQPFTTTSNRRLAVIPTSKEAPMLTSQPAADAIIPVSTQSAPPAIVQSAYVPVQDGKACEIRFADRLGGQRPDDEIVQPVREETPAVSWAAKEKFWQGQNAQKGRNAIDPTDQKLADIGRNRASGRDR